MSNRRRKGRPISGWLILDKPLNQSSAAAVGAVKRTLRPQKIGHAGTLDPLASGILPLALGEATKTVPFMMAADKGYDFSLAWGVSTTTDDLEGEILEQNSRRPGEVEIQAILPQFIGEINQAPPIYSALKVDGQRAYKLARAGQLEALPKRRVACFSLVLLSCDEDQAHFRLRCGKGFYVRSLARDLGLALGTCAHVTALRRTHVGPFGLGQSISLAFLDQLRDKPRQDLPVLPLEVVLDDIPVLTLEDEQVGLLRQGRVLSLDKPPFFDQDPGQASLGLSRLALVKQGHMPVGLVDMLAPEDGQGPVSCKVRRLFNLHLELQSEA